MRAIVERVSYARGVPTRGHANRELAEWVAQFSTKGEVELRKIHCDEIKARRERERLEWLAQISARAEAELRQIRSAKAQQRRKREQLQWLAQISDGHERQLRLWSRRRRGPQARPLRAVRRGLARARGMGRVQTPATRRTAQPGLVGYKGWLQLGVCIAHNAQRHEVNSLSARPIWSARGHGERHAIGHLASTCSVGSRAAKSRERGGRGGRRGRRRTLGRAPQRQHVAVLGARACRAGDARHLGLRSREAGPRGTTLA